MKIYEIQELTFAYPDASSERDDVFLPPALAHVNLTVNSGDFIIVAGGSGSGKTTLLRQLKACLTPRGKKSGRIFFEGEPLENTEERKQVEKIGFVSQDVSANLVTDKVWHELAFGLEGLGKGNGFIKKRVAEICSFFGLNDIYHKKVNELSGGEMQLVNLASVVAMSPEVLILDEPSSQLDPIATMEFFNCLGRVNRELGTTVIISEHRLEELWQFANRIVVMEKGNVIYDGQKNNGIRKIHENINTVEIPAAAKIYLELSKHSTGDIPIAVSDGKKWLADYDKDHSHEEIKAHTSHSEGKEIALDIRDVFFKYEKNGNDILSGLSLTIYKNEILAINGSNGCGKSTLLSLLSGTEKPYRGRVKNPHSLKAFLLPQDPKLLFTRVTVEQELYKADGEHTDEIVSLCELDDLLGRHPYDLSGGEQERLGLAKILLNKPDIILLDEPTKGMDAEYKRSFGEILKALVGQGKTIVLVSHDIEFCAKIADRMCLIFDGKTAVCGRTSDYLAENEFYTTAAARIAKGTLDGAVAVEDILSAYGKKLQNSKKKKDVEKNSDMKKNGSREITEKNVISEPEIEEKNDKTTTKTPHFSKARALGLILTGIIMCISFYITVTQSDLTQLIQNGTVTKTGIGYILIYISFIVSTVLFIILLKPIGHKHNEEIELKKKNSIKNIIVTIICLIAIIITIWFGNVVLSDRKYYFISLLVLIEAMIPFLVAFENKKFKARDIVTVAVMCAIGVAGRAAFFMIPNFNPVMAIIIITGAAFGCETGFVTGAVTMLVSNMIFGQGPWTPWQMFSLGLIGFFAGLIFNNSGVRSRPVTKLGLCVFGTLSCILIYGAIMNPASVIMWQPFVNAQMIAAAYITGFPFDVVQGFATAIFLWLTARPFLEKLDRIKIKYGVLISSEEENSSPEDESQKDPEPASQIPGVDMEKGMSYLANDETLYREILQTYISDCDERIEKLNSFKENNDIKGYEISIHGLKSASATIGADEVSKMAADLEKMCMDKATATGNIGLFHDDMILKYKELTDNIKKWLANNETNVKIEGKK